MKFVTCSACGESVPAESVNDRYPDGGLVLPYEEFGYYGGFTDIEFGCFDIENYPKTWLMCHDCVVKLFTVFPLLGKTFARGTHPCSDEKPCCEWAWRATENFGKYTTDSAGKSVPVPGPHYQIVKDGQWVDAVD